MGKMMSLVIGAVITLVGLILLIAWWYEFTFLLRAVIPGILILAGIIAVVAGLGEMKDILKRQSEKK
jgi:uncharacterized membrane protein YqjE